MLCFRPLNLDYSTACLSRARSLPALPSSGESSAWQSQHPQQSGEEALPIIPSSRHATPATSPPRESGGGRTRASLLEKKAIDPLIDGEYGDSLVINDEDEVATLRELLRHKEEDLRMAAMIGQRLLDKQEELAADLEVGKVFHAATTTGVVPVVQHALAGTQQYSVPCTALHI